MKNILIITLLLISVSSCRELLEPDPINELTNDIILTHPDDVEGVRLGLYNAFRGIAAPTVIVGDFTADMITHRGTFTQYQEFGNKEITASNAAVEALWRAIYQTSYISNFILERLPELPGVPANQRKDVLATARFLRGYAMFIGAYTFGGIPISTSTDVETNNTLPRSTKEEVLQLVLEDYLYALENIAKEPINSAFAGVDAVNAALARYYLYAGDWNNAEAYATSVINSENYSLENFPEVAYQDDSDEFILKVGYSISDDPGTSATGLNNLFIGRREVVPSNKVVRALYSTISGDRDTTLIFNLANLKGSDNGWSVGKYGTSDDNNNDIIIFRLGEIYLIRAEARAMQGKVVGTGSAQEDINMLRERANAPLVGGLSQAQMISTIEEERFLELAFEGHRWYDLVRTGRANTVMSSFSPNWKEIYNVLPIPLREIQNNPSLNNSQNAGY